MKAKVLTGAAVHMAAVEAARVAAERKAKREEERKKGKAAWAKAMEAASAGKDVNAYLGLLKASDAAMVALQAMEDAEASSQGSDGRGGGDGAGGEIFKLLQAEGNLLATVQPLALAKLKLGRLPAALYVFEMPFAHVPE